MRSFPILALATAMLAGPALAEAQAKSSTGPVRMHHAGPADRAFMASTQTMMKSMDKKPTGNTDKDFVLMMMPHHQGAIDMAKVEMRFGRDPILRRMAAHIIKAQDQEIRAMKAWLARRRK